MSKHLEDLSEKERLLFELLLQERRQGKNVSRTQKIARRPKQNHAPLSFAQERLWFLDQLEPENSAYNLSFSRLLRGQLNVRALEQSVNEIVRRHEVLRTTFATIQGKPLQLIHPPTPLPIRRLELSGLARPEQQGEVRRLAQQEAEQPFELERWPLLRVSLVTLAADEHVLLLVMHHIVSDGWSMRLLIGELGALYRALVAGEISPLGELPIQYADYAVWQREWLKGAVLEQQLAYWKEQLGGELPLLELPTDRARPAQMSHRGARQELELSEELTNGLRQLAAQHGVTMFMTLLAGFVMLLHRYTGSKDVVVGAPVAGRGRREVEELIGLFANTLALRVQLRGDETVSEMLERVRRVALGAYEHQEIPFEKVVDELHPQRHLSYTPIFQVALALQNTSEGTAELPGLSMESMELQGGRTKFDLDLDLADSGKRIFGALDYSTDLFDESTIKRMLDHFETLLEGAVANSSQRVSSLPLMSEEEQHQMLFEWNQTATNYPHDDLVQHLFESQVSRTPDSTALNFEGEQLTYRELNERSNQLAHHLQSLSVGPDVLVGICMERSVEMIVGLLAVLKAGGAYVPLDPEHPQSRLAFMLQDSQLSVLLTQARLVNQLPPTDATTICLDTDWRDVTRYSSDNPVSQVLPENLAYVIYTSGSTGQPKAVVVQHRNISNFLLATQTGYQFSASDVMPCFVSFAFDVFLFQLFSPMLAGGTCLLLSKETLFEPAAFARVLRSVTVLHGIPSLLNQQTLYLQQRSAGDSFPRLRLVCVGGEFVAPELIKRLQQVFPAATVYEDYGPTEATIICTAHRCEREAAVVRSLIGRPLANLRLYVCDAQLQPVPIGVAGELCIGGAGVARGYLGQAALTAARFLPDPFAERAGARLYKTGDRVRYLADGAVEFLGRLDEQVKIRGYRIELGEIEAALLQHAAVSEGCVLVRQTAAEQPQLIAYLVLAATTEAEQREQVEQLKTYLRQRLPEYMLPTVYVPLRELPLTVNGKLNKQALLALPIGAVRATQMEPRNEVEEKLVEIWRSVLGLAAVGVEENFFELGGDSILSIQIIARANEAGLRFTPRQLFEQQTIAGLAAVGGSVARVKAEQGAVSGAVALTPVQQQFLEAGWREPEHHNQAVMLRVRERLQPGLVAQAVSALLKQHDALRLRFRQDEQGCWQQFNAASERHSVFESVDLSRLPVREQSAAIEAAAAQWQASLNLGEGPLLRVVYFECGEEQAGRLLLIIHHLAVDGVSWRILLADLEAALEQLRAGVERVSLAAKTTSYQQWAEALKQYAQRPAVAAEVSYWRAQQGECPLPVDYGGAENRVSSARRVEVSLSAAETEALLHAVPAAYQTRIEEVLLTALVIAVGEWRGQRRVLVELEGHGREEIGDEVDVTRTVGWFTSVYPLLLEVAEAGSAGEWLKAVKEQVRRVPQRGIGYGLLRYLRKELSSGARAELSFNYLGQLDQAFNQSTLFELARESVGPERSENERRSSLLNVNSRVIDGRLQISWEYSAQAHLPQTIERLAQRYMEALRDLIEHCLSPHAGGFTPSDFSKMKFSQEELDELVDDLSEFVED